MERKRQPKGDDRDLDLQLDDEIARLRQMLVIMAAEPGASALGAARPVELREPDDAKEPARITAS